MRWIFTFWLGLTLAIGQFLLPAPLQSAPSGCNASYPDVCIPSSPPDLNCKDITFRNFRVLPPDPHRFDGDKDGIGCEARR